MKLARTGNAWHRDITGQQAMHHLDLAGMPLQKSWQMAAVQAIVLKFADRFCRMSIRPVVQSAQLPCIR